MKKGIQSIAIFIMISSLLHAREYIYPVATSKSSGDCGFIYVVNQKTVDDLQLFAWDPATNISYSLLQAFFTPLSVSVIPDGSGFSFIDKGRIRIKKFNKRSPKTIDLYDSIYDPAGVTWVDGWNGYFYAKKRDRYGIFHLSGDGNAYTIALSDAYDCMYPQKVGDDLFYIKRTPVESESGYEYYYSVIKRNYPTKYFSDKSSFNDIDNFHEQVKELLKEQESNGLFFDQQSVTSELPIIDFGDNPIAFLSMIDLFHGFFIEHEKTIDQKKSYMTCTYHELLYQDGHWSTKPLFNYHVPSELLFDPSVKLIEPFAIFLPYCHNNTIYFSDCLGESEQLHAFEYTHEKGVSKVEHCNSNTRIAFRPCCFEGSLFYGGLCDEKEVSLSLVKIFD